ncbi:MAG: hypothetical protein H0X66_02220 [Verrucomicrobia bacterium]|nr:hypothetical protein [Verrucomicrobiota bacterium]
MNNSKTSSEYILLFSGPDWDQGISPEELQQRLDKVMAWFDGLQEQGRVKGGQPLAREGRTLSGQKVSDGPFAESKEAIGGYLLITADSIEEATNIAKSSPTLEYGVNIEVRQVLDECPCFKRAKERLALATA